MFLKSVFFKDLRCFTEFSVDLGLEGASLLILGENGGGKSTILRAIAMGLCDQSSAAALFRELPGEFVRREPGEEEVPKGRIGKIYVELVDTVNSEAVYGIPTTIQSLDKFERVQQFNKIDVSGSDTKMDEGEFPWANIFVSGYGAGIRTQGTADYRHYLPVDAIYSIFNYDVQLQNPELAVRRLKDAAEASTDDQVEGKERSSRVLESVKNLLAELLVLGEEDSIELESTGIVVYGRWGRAELGELGDGYRAVITLVLDLISWWFLHCLANDSDEKAWLDFKGNDIQGIVFIDEIEQHLHPRWQKIIIPMLLDCFPKVQFVITSHSPLCVVGTARVNEGKTRLKTVVLQEEHGSAVYREVQPPKNLRADQVLTGLYFGLSNSGDDEIQATVERYASIMSNPSVDKADEMQRLREELMETLGSEETELQRKVSKAVQQVLEKEETAFASDAIHFEVLRQLRDLL